MQLNFEVVKNLVRFFLLREVRMTQHRLVDSIKNALQLGPDDFRITYQLRKMLTRLVDTGHIILIDREKHCDTLMIDGDGPPHFLELNTREGVDELGCFRDWVTQVTSALDMMEISTNRVSKGHYGENPGVVSALTRTVSDRVKLLLAEALVVPQEKITDGAALFELADTSEDFAMLWVNITEEFDVELPAEQRLPGMSVAELTERVTEALRASAAPVPA